LYYQSNSLLLLLPSVFSCFQVFLTYFASYKWYIYKYIGYLLSIEHLPLCTHTWWAIHIPQWEVTCISGHIGIFAECSNFGSYAQHVEQWLSAFGLHH
jgi:hypothetical protein